MLPVPRSWADLTPAWMTDALAPHFPGAVVAGVDVVDLADGTNRRGRVRLTYRSGEGPERLFVKREGRLLPRLALLALGALEAEARLCLAAAPLPLEHPELYAAAVDRRRLAVVVVMEDVTIRSGRPNHATVPLAVAQVRSGLTALADLHAAWWDRPRPASLAFLRPWRLGPAWAPVSWASLVRARHRLRSLGQAALLPADADAATLERGFRRWATIAATGPQTVLHGDPHPGNTYTLPDPHLAGTGPGGTVGFYDWQLVRAGSWAHDVGYFLVSSLAVIDRRDHERALVHGYLDDLRRAGVPDPDRARAWDLYRQTPAFGLGTWLHTLSGAVFQPVDVCLATIERFAAAYADHGLGRTG